MCFEISMKNKRGNEEKMSKTKEICIGISRFFITLLITIIFVLLILIITVKMICSNISPSAKELYATTMLETGQLKFMATSFMSEAELQEIVSKNSVKTMNAEIDKNLININNSNSRDMSEIKIEEVSGQTFYAKMMIINDPSRVKLATTYPWSEYGEELENLVKQDDSIAGINGGLYVSVANKGGYPLGVVVCNGDIQYNNPSRICWITFNWI